MEQLETNDALDKLLLEKIQLCSSNIVIFVMSMFDCERYCKLFIEHGHQAVSYYSDLELDQRRLNLKAFRGSGANIIVATSAFSMGIDVGDVSLVIHVRGSYSFIDYVQECGRAGRQGQKAICLMILLQDDLADKDETFQQYKINTSQCRRSLISGYMDGNTSFCFQETSCSYCDICTSLSVGHQLVEKIGEKNTKHSFRNSISRNKSQPEPISLLKGDIVDIQCSSNSSLKVCSTENDINKSSSIWIPFENDAAIQVLPAVKNVNNEQNTEEVLVGKQSGFFVDKPSSQLPIIHVAKKVKTDSIIMVTTLMEKARQLLEYGCIVCNFKLKKRCRHDRGINGCSTLEKSCCLRCLMPGSKHNAKSCPFKVSKGNCFLCGFPGHIQGKSIHTGFGRDCSVKIPDVLLPLVWLIWHDNPKIGQIFREMGLNFERNEMGMQGYITWLCSRQQNDIPHMMRVLEYAIDSKWVLYS